MNLLSNMAGPWSQVIGWTLINSLWQALLIYLTLKLLWWLIPMISFRARYLSAVLALALALGWFLLTFYGQLRSYLSSAGIPESRALPGRGMPGAGLVLPSLSPGLPELRNWLNSLMLVFALGYLAGLTWSFIGLSRDLNRVRVLKSKGLRTLEDSWMKYIRGLASTMGIHKPIGIYLSELARVPMVIGYLKPVILIPLGCFSNLNPEQLESILIHELSHILRRDYLVNLLQSLVETLLFFNPFIRLISSAIREERENCCDRDVTRRRNPLTYAQALLTLEQNRQDPGGFALSAVSHPKKLLQRIRHIMESRSSSPNLLQKLGAALILALAFCSIAWLNPGREIWASGRTADTTRPGLVISHQPVISPSSPRTPGLRTIAPMPEGPGIPGPLPPPPLTPPAPLSRVSLAEVNHQDGWSRALSDSRPPYRVSPAAQVDTAPGPDWKAEQQASNQGYVDSFNHLMNTKAWKANMDVMKLAEARMHAFLNSPEWKKLQGDMNIASRNMTAYFKSPVWKKQQEDIKKAALNMKAYFNSPQWKKQQEDIKKAALNMKAYFNSPQWKQQQEDIKKTARRNIQVQLDSLKMNQVKQKPPQ